MELRRGHCARRMCEDWKLELKLETGAFEMWIWRRIETISYTEHVTNEEVLNRVSETRVLIKMILRRKKNWIGHVLRGEGMMKEIIEGKLDGRKDED